jgi:hypothetical protein
VYLFKTRVFANVCIWLKNVDELTQVSPKKIGEQRYKEVNVMMG